MTPAKVKQPCKRAGCKGVLSKEARIAGDDYCSALCSRLDHGTITEQEAAMHLDRSERATGGAMTWRTQNSNAWERSGRGGGHAA